MWEHIFTLDLTLWKQKGGGGESNAVQSRRWVCGEIGGYERERMKLKNYNSLSSPGQMKILFIIPMTCLGYCGMKSIIHRLYWMVCRHLHLKRIFASQNAITLVSVFCQLPWQLQSQQNWQKQITTRPEPASLTTQNFALSGSEMHDLTRIVVTMSVLFASVSETLISRLVEFIAKVLLEYQIPI